jgi:hypothetical protein
MIGRTLLIVIALVSALGAGGMAWVARGLAFAWFERPAIIREQQAIAALEVTAAAAKATRDEQLRQFHIGEAAAERHLQAQLQADADRQAERQTIEMEIRTYEQRMAEIGRACALDADDLDFLGLRYEPVSNAPGGGGAGASSGPGATPPIAR